MLLPILFLISFPGPASEAGLAKHALYLASIQLKHQSGSPETGILIKLFADDLQSAVRNHSAEFKPGPLEELFQDNAPLIAQYFSTHLLLKVNDTPLELVLSGYELQNDVFLLEFDASCPVAWQEVHLRADFFMELFPTQTNVLQIVNGDQRQFTRLTSQQPDCRATF